MEEQCTERVPDSTMRGHQCTRKAKVFSEGKGYCTQHSPEVVARREAESRERFDQEWARRKEAWDKQARRLEAAGELAEAAEKIADKLDRERVCPICSGAYLHKEGCALNSLTVALAKWQQE